MSSSEKQPMHPSQGTQPVVVRFVDVTKTYELYTSERSRLLHMFTHRANVKTVDANHDLSFTIHRGEAVAFLGSNGAGKTTALKMIAGVSRPTSGMVEVNGKVSAMLNLTAGFNPLLTGEENLRQRGHVWGLDNKSIDALLPEIVDFAELGEYIHQPLRTYSSGMKARLGFSFVSSLKPDILILDEVLAVGDRRFAKKSLARMKEIISRDAVTLLFVTHSSGSARSFCQRGIVLDKGRTVYDGPIRQAIKFYETGLDSPAEVTRRRTEALATPILDTADVAAALIHPDPAVTDSPSVQAELTSPESKSRRSATLGGAGKNATQAKLPRKTKWRANTRGPVQGAVAEGGAAAPPSSQPPQPSAGTSPDSGHNRVRGAHHAA